jgi:hypothetical protein
VHHAPVHDGEEDRKVDELVGVAVRGVGANAVTSARKPGAIRPATSSSPATAALASV